LSFEHLFDIVKRIEDPEENNERFAVEPDDETADGTAIRSPTKMPRAYPNPPTTTPAMRATSAPSNISPTAIQKIA